MTRDDAKRIERYLTIADDCEAKADACRAEGSSVGVREWMQAANQALAAVTVIRRDDREARRP